MFIQISLEIGDYWINGDQIISITQYKEYGSTIEMSNGKTFHAQNDVDSILDQIGKGKLVRNSTVASPS